MNSERKPFLTWLIIITVFGCALRVFRLNEIPFTYDELSALFRTHYNTFGELIHKGVAGDGHPAGVQVFLYYWVSLFGEAEWIVKLPFIVMGILCIPLIYHIGTKWFSKDTGIIAACLMAGLQYPVMYSQIARPYISGLFLILLLAAIWNSVMVKTTTRNLIAFAVVLALCAYNHYFSMLTAACVAATGLFVIERKNLLKYILAMFLAVVFFLPHLPLFLGHLKIKGLEWVPVPTPGFFKNYFYYIINFSDYILAAILLLLAQGAYFYTKRRQQLELKYRVIALLWFAIPAVTGYFYSVYRAPVLETSVLIFGFPFMVLFVCSFITLPASYLRDIEIGALLLVLIVSLGWERHYYQIFYHAETEMFARHISGYEKAYGNDRVAAVVNTNPKYLGYYRKKYGTGWNFQTFDSIGGNNAWRRWLEKCNAGYLVLCNPQQEWGSQYLSIAQEYFHCVDSIYYGFTTNVYILKKDTALCRPLPLPFFKIDFDSAGVSKSYAMVSNAEGHQTAYQACDTTGQLGPIYFALQSNHFEEKMKINESVDVYVDSVKPDGFLCIQFKDSTGHVLQERKSLIENFVDRGNGWNTVYLTARLYHAPVKNTSKILVSLVVGPQACLKFKNFRIEGVPDNPILYTLIKK